MADQVGTTPFKYVTVEQDDDELVIEAGLRTSKPAHAQSATEDVEAASASAQTAAADSSAAVKGTSDGESAKEVDAAYRETTLDDLKHEPMPKMQRAVLLGIAALVIVFVAYVLFF